MKKIIEYGIIGTVGGIAYMIIELLWKASTHWTMGIAGGISFIVMYLVHNKMPGVNILYRALLCGASVTAIEFVTGFIVNIKLGWDVWDYSARSFNILGQVCPTYMLIWIVLSIPASEICKILKCIIGRHLEAKVDCKIKTEKEISG